MPDTRLDVPPAARRGPARPRAGGGARHRGDHPRHRGPARRSTSPRPQALIDGDDELDALTLDIEERCFTILARQQPMASDLRAVVTAIRLTVGDRALRRPHGQRRQGRPAPLRQPGRRPRSAGCCRRWATRRVRLYRLAMDAYADGDAGLAGALDDMDDRLDELHRDYIQAILELYADVARRAGGRAARARRAATTSASATTPSTSASGCGTWSPAGCPSTPARSPRRANAG